MFSPTILMFSPTILAFFTLHNNSFKKHIRCLAITICSSYGNYLTIICTNCSCRIVLVLFAPVQNVDSKPSDCLYLEALVNVNTPAGHTS